MYLSHTPLATSHQQCSQSCRCEGKGNCDTQKVTLSQSSPTNKMSPLWITKNVLKSSVSTFSFLSFFGLFLSYMSTNGANFKAYSQPLYLSVIIWCSCLAIQPVSTDSQDTCHFPIQPVFSLKVLINSVSEKAKHSENCVSVQQMSIMEPIYWWKGSR